VRKGDNENEDRTGCVQTEAVIACRGRALRMTKANRGPRVLIRRPVWRWLRKSVSVPNYGRVEFLTSALDLYPRGKSFRYPSDRRLSGPQSRSGRDGEERKFHAPAGDRNPVVQPIGQSLYWLNWPIQLVGKGNSVSMCCTVTRIIMLT